LTVAACTCSKSSKPEHTLADSNLGSLRVGSRSIAFYVAYGADSAVLGFSVSDATSPLQYFPLYGSTYRGLPSGTFDVFLSKDEAKMWVRSSWKGWETLAYHRFGSTTCMTQYGEVAARNDPMPSNLGGFGEFPAMDEANVTKALTMTHVGETH
jgi:hypothetical protein